MANTKISQLPSATTPVVGTEVLPIVQSSTTSKVSIANLTAGRAVSASSYAVTGFDTPTNGVYLVNTNTLSISTNGLRTATFTNANNFDVGTGNTVAGQRFIQASNLSTDPAASAILVSKSDSQIFQLVAYSSTYPAVSGITLAGKAQLYAGGSAGSSGLQIWDNSATPQIDFILGTTVAGTFSDSFNLDVGTGSSANTTRYVRAKNLNTGSSAYATVYSQSDAQIAQLQAYSSTYPSASGITLAGKAVLYTGGTATSTGLTLWDNSNTPTVQFVVGAGTVAGTIDSSGNWNFNTKAISGIGALTANSFIPNGSSVPTNGMYLPSANTVSIATNSTVAASFTSTGNFDVGTGNSANTARFVRALNASTGSSAYASIYSQSDVQIAQLQAYSSTYPSASGITLAGKAVVYATGASSTGLTFWDNSATPAMQFVVGTTSAGTINSSAVLSLTSNPILTSGTANGVAYLNGSKVLTTGSALTFNGTRFTIVGGNADSLRVDNGGQQYTEIDIANNGTVKSNIYWDNTNTNLFYSSTGSATYASASYHSWNISGEQMRLTSTGLGIGTSSLGAKLDVQGSAIFARVKSTGTTYNGFRSQNDNGNFYFGLDDAAGGFYGTANARVLYADGAYPMVFYTNAAERMRLDSSGNLGLGVTPSAWSSNVKAIEFNAGSIASYSAAGVYSSELRCNSIGTSGGEVYKNTARASSFGYDTNAGAYYWRQAPSGEAGTAITTFTQAMTLNANGNFSLGTTSPSEFSGYITQSINGTNGSFTEYRQNNTNTFRIGADSSAGGFLFTQAANPIRFGINGSEAARIDSSGNLLVGSTTLLPDANHFSYSPGNTWGVFGHSTGVASTTDFVRFNYAGSRIGSISQAGTTGVLYNVTSDYRLKTVIGPVANAGQRIDALQPVEYTWNASGERTRGFLAHQFQEVYAGSVSGTKDAVDAEGKPVYQSMQASSSEVIADLVAEIQSLRQRLAAAGI